ncbi:hypothetical protein BWI15_19920 [Kribbella sp. ALI-6-A]|uniref:serine hydrolase domain-containing protein n=1 Tax=Kribbella sp. ALI-6-A TaxID=1933817 RepID=UPI00097C3DB0|nr:serine hydrolase [Kribbella sp. ALI-6-A]ONI72317.1 hypothetical protein BWI15_19920 [Kribbella sp. ALI-6-A]
MGTLRRTLTSAVCLAMLALTCCSGPSQDEPAPTIGTATPPTERAPDPAPRALGPADAKKLQAVLDKVASRYADMPDAEVAARGLTAAIVSDRWSWSGAAGTDAIGTKLTPATSLGIASVTKTFVAAEVLLLARAGRIALDAPLALYVRHKLTANNSTVRQHLAMTSGVPDYKPGDYAALDPAVAAAPSRHWTPEQALAYLSTPVGPPGTYDYSNPSYVLLGMLIEKVTGQPLATVLRRDLAQPAGLARVAFQDGETPRLPVARTRNPICGSAFDGYLPCRAIASLAAANGGATADAPSVARWGYQLYGGRVLPAELVAAMTAGEGDYGLGTRRFSLRFGNAPAYGHDGNFPDHCSIVVAIPALRVSIAVLVAEGGKNAGAIAADLVTAARPLLG